MAEDKVREEMRKKRAKMLAENENVSMFDEDKPEEIKEEKELPVLNEENIEDRKLISGHDSGSPEGYARQQEQKRKLEIYKALRNKGKL